MTAPFNRLTPAEAERLALLLEEMGEATQAVGKILRHGYESTHPGGGPTNRESLEKELGDVRAATWMMIHAGDVSDSAIEMARTEKNQSVRKYLHHQQQEEHPFINQEEW